MTTSERWLPVINFEETYEVSDIGRVRRTKTQRVLRPGLMKRGYLLVSLWVGGRGHSKAVHSLVARAFLGPVPDGHEVNHKDSDRTNARLDNLEYMTRSQNLAHGYKFGRVRPPKKKHGPNRHYQARKAALNVQ